MQVNVIWYSGCGGRTYFGLCDAGSDIASVSGFGDLTAECAGSGTASVSGDGVLTVEWKRFVGRDWSRRRGSDGCTREAKRGVDWERRREEVERRRNTVKGEREGGILDYMVIGCLAL